MRFYILKPEQGIRFGTKWAYADIVEPSNSGESEKCPVCGGPVSLKKWLPPHRIKLSSAKSEKWGDFVWGAGFPLLVSTKFKEVYATEGLSGIAEFSSPVEIVRIGTRRGGDFPVKLPDYHLIHVPWGGANQDDDASGMVHEQPQKITCEYCRVDFTWRKQNKIIIEDGTWKGLDIFKPRGAPVQFMVSEKFKQVVERYELKNAWLIPGEKFGFDERRPRSWYVQD